MNPSTATARGVPLPPIRHAPVLDVPSPQCDFTRAYFNHLIDYLELLCGADKEHVFSALEPWPGGIEAIEYITDHIIPWTTAATKYFHLQLSSTDPRDRLRRPMYFCVTELWDCLIQTGSRDRNVSRVSRPRVRL